MWWQFRKEELFRYAVFFCHFTIEEHLLHNADKEVCTRSCKFSGGKQNTLAYIKMLLNTEQPAVVYSKQLTGNPIETVHWKKYLAKIRQDDQGNLCKNVDGFYVLEIREIKEK